MPTSGRVCRGVSADVLLFVLLALGSVTARAATVLAPIVRNPLILPLSGQADWSKLAGLPVQLIGHGETVMVRDARRERIVFYDGYHSTAWVLPLEGAGPAACRSRQRPRPC